MFIGSFQNQNMIIADHDLSRHNITASNVIIKDGK